MGRLWQRLRAQGAAPRARPAAAWGQLAPSSICWRRAALSTSSLLWLQPRLRLEQGHRALAQHPSTSPFPPCSSVGRERTWLSPRGTAASPAQSPNPTEHHPGPSIPARPLRGDSTARPSAQGTPTGTFRALSPKELPAPLPQPCQQPGSSLESSALPEGSCCLPARRGWQGPRGCSSAKPGSGAGNKPRLILRAGTWSVLRGRSRMGAGMCWAPPFVCPRD